MRLPQEGKALRSRKARFGREDAIEDRKGKIKRGMTERK